MNSVLKWSAAVFGAAALAAAISFAAPAPDAADNADLTEAPSDARPAVARRPARPELTEQQYADLAASLRTAYSKAPAQWPAPTVDPGVEHHELGLLPPAPFPADNPYSKEKETLGKLLFFDPRLSGSGQIACASCHDPDLAWADGRGQSFGHDRARLSRNAPSLLLSAYVKPLFWDGRAESLEEQFHAPIAAHEEMNGDADAVLKRLNAIPEYRQQFNAAFGTDKITMADAAKAVATFERSLAKLAGRSSFDRFLKGKAGAISDAAVRGLHLFRTDARCINCHNGPLFSDNGFHDVGLSYYGRKNEDLGRHGVTFDAKDVGAFHTPSLRNVARTRPYMHNGFFDLDGILNIYNTGMPTLRPTAANANDPLFPVKDKLLQPLGLNVHDKADLKAFLESLTEPVLVVHPPKLPQEVARAPEAAP